VPIKEEPTDKGCPCVYVMHNVMYVMWWHNRNKGRELAVALILFFKFFLRQWFSWVVEYYVEVG
jgi:hypothetical protein